MPVATAQLSESPLLPRLLLWPLLWWGLFRPLLLSRPLLRRPWLPWVCQAALRRKVALVVPRRVGAHSLLPLPECVPPVVEHAQG